MSTDWSAPLNIPTNDDDNNDDENNTRSLLHRIRFRDARPTDIPTCFDLEQASYPEDEAATRSKFQYRQHHAASFFRCAVLFDNAQAAAAGDDTAATTTVIGFVNATRCRVFTHHSMATHISGGPLLAIHSVVVQEQYRRQGIATAMLQDYVETLHERQDERMLVRSIVLMAKANLLPFYVKAGFSVIRLSPIVHGSEPWYELELDMMRYESKIAAAAAAAASSSSSTSPTGTMTATATAAARRLTTTKHCLPCYIVDAFVDPHRPAGTGNQAAVVLCENNMMEMMQQDEVEDLLTLEWMQTVAAEFNLAETAFVWQLPPATAAAASAATAAATTSDNEATTSTASSSSPVTIPRPTASDDDEAETPSFVRKELRYGIRYFTPTVQVPLCGHATLAAAAVLYQTEPALLEDTRNQTSIVFYAPQDVLRAKQGSLRSSLTKITMEFPTKPPSEIENDDEAVAANATHILEQAFGIDAQHILYLGISDIGDLLVELTQDCFLTLQVKDINALTEWNGYTRGVCVCCQNNNLPLPEEIDATTAATDDTGSQYGGSRGGGANPEIEIDFFSRFFAPKAGIAEDPVTGSAHCVLAPYFASKLQKDRVIGFQRSKRGGIVECQLIENDRVKITGSAGTIMSGSLWLKRSHLL